MADGKNQGMGYGGKKIQNNGKSNPSSVFNRSMTINSSSAAAAGENRPFYNLYGSAPLQRNGSVKSSYSSSFGSKISAGNSFKGKVKKLCSIFESPKSPSSTPNSQSLASPTSTKHNKGSSTVSDSSHVVSKSGYSLVPDSPLTLPGTEDRVVIYFTSLRGIRRTFQDCHSVFVKGKYIGGADLIKQLLEVGELGRLVKGLPLRPPKPCEACDDMRFVPCMKCDGSRKVFDEDEEVPKRCPECNENGLVRCPLCCS
ncbi:UNVERIFIED_CONTAM: hypothetical protein Sradi_2664000 [Sesamum radiatum]|uniref:Glutaredoxin family protein n=1 Tax=Sesamum radiatum TaxID=300843 RepID=A0AAW2S612_SESRA